MLPPRLPKKPKRTSRVRCPAHLKWVREHACSACGATEQIQAAHIRSSSDGGMAVKPGDQWAVSLCHPCHARQHMVGEAEFQMEWDIDLVALALEFAKKSPRLSPLRT